MRRKLNFPEAGNILSEVIEVFYRGKHTGSDNQATVMTDYGDARQNVSFAFLDEVVGKTIYNLTDGCKGVITSVTNNTITCSAGLSGGSGDDWDEDDEYVVGDRALNVLIAGVAPPGASLPPHNGYDTINDNRKLVTAAGTRERLVAASTPCKKVEVQALGTNTKSVVIGGSTVVAAPGTQRGIPLLAWSTFTIYIEDLYNVYIDAEVSGEGVTFAYFE